MLCCVCLLDHPKNMDIFDDKGQKLEVAEIIYKHLWFKPEPDNILTREICRSCWQKIYDFHIFYRSAEKTHEEYQRHTKYNIKTEISFDNSIKLEQDYDTCNKNVNHLEEEITSDNNCEIQNVDEFETKNPLEEINTECVPYVHETDEDECISSDDYDEADILSDQNSCYEQEFSDDKETISRNQDDYSIIKKSRKRHVMKKAETRKKQVISHLNPAETEAIVKKHIPMGCNLCVFVGKSFSDIIEHFKLAHSKIKPYILCCDRKLKKRFYIVQHALKHENPKCFSCEECNKSFTTSIGLGNHNLRYHAREEDLIYACDQCPKKFARKNILELHKISHIPKEEWQYFCKICPNKRSFASLNLLNIHINMRHKREKNICPVCAKEIKDKKSFEKHVRLHHEDSGPRIKCPYDDCDSWLKDEDNLRQHLKRHNPEGIIYKCDQCDKECKNRRALTNHKRYAHSNEIFQCEQCDKTFKKAISLREHMTQHTGETLYKCPFCIKTFNSNANMHAHKKKIHPVEWDEWRKNKRGSAQKLINCKNPLTQLDETFRDLKETLRLF